MAIPQNEEEAERYFDQLTAPWRDQLLTSAKGIPKPILANVITALRHAPEWAGKLQYDAFYQRTMFDGVLPWAERHERRIWMPEDDLLATNWIQHQEIFVTDETVHKAIETVARDLTYHPVLDYLKPLVWDGESRLDKWVVDYLGVADTPYARAVGAKFLISAIARVMQPGCKVDCALILEGKQGAFKSTALRVIFAPHFTDEISEIGSKDAAMQMAGVWGIELAELEGLNRSDTGRIKAALSRSTDRYRPPWGRRVIDQPRQCVFCGTVNHNQYLRDETGGRRFWPLVVGKIDIPALMAIRDQLWSEALARYQDGEVWWLDSQVLTDAALEEQRTRRVPDPWDDEIEQWAANEESVIPSEFLAHVDIPKKDWTQLHLNRVASALKALGYARRSIRYRGEPRHRYVRE